MSHLSWIATKDDHWISKWDSLQMESPKGMFTQASSWLMSYAAYGFDYVLFLGVNGDQILAGFGCLIVKIGPFRLINCNWGPYYEEGIDPKTCLTQLKFWAKNQGAIALQINVPTEEINLADGIDKEGVFSKGNLMKKVFSPLYFNWITLPTVNGPDAEKELLKSFSENARRNIKTGLKNDLMIERVTSSDQLREVYSCFENNAAREGYLIREWNDVKDSLSESLRLGQAIFFQIRQEDNLIGAIWAAKGGRSYHYIMGGVERTTKDLKVGHLLQWSVMKASMEEGFSKYNISVGGSDGVVRFKSSFNPTEIASAGVFHLILNPLNYRIFQYGFKFAERNKKLASRLLKLIRKSKK